mgnify:CR=1 FL=1
MVLCSVIFSRLLLKQILRGQAAANDSLSRGERITYSSPPPNTSLGLVRQRRCQCVGFSNGAGKDSQGRRYPAHQARQDRELAVRNAGHGEPVRNVEALANPEALEYFRDRAELRDLAGIADFLPRHARDTAI